MYWVIRDANNDKLVTETDTIDGYLSFTRYPAVFNTHDDAYIYMLRMGVSEDDRINVRVHDTSNMFFEDYVVLVTFNDETETNTDTTDNIVAALRLIRSLCKKQGSCTTCPLRLTSDTCSITHKCPEKWTLVGDDPNEADKLFV